MPCSSSCTSRFQCFWHYSLPLLHFECKGRSAVIVVHPTLGHLAYVPSHVGKLTPQERARELIMKKEIALQAREEQAVVGQVQALREKFAAAANAKCLLAQEPEVRWVGAQPELPSKAPDAIMAEATLTLPGIQPELGTVKRGSRGSKFCWAAI
jgi:hypothetical protein